MCHHRRQRQLPHLRSGFQHKLHSSPDPGHNTGGLSDDNFQPIDCDQRQLRLLRQLLVSRRLRSAPARWGQHRRYSLAGQERERRCGQRRNGAARRAGQSLQRGRHGHPGDDHHQRQRLLHLHRPLRRQLSGAGGWDERRHQQLRRHLHNCGGDGPGERHQSPQRQPAHGQQFGEQCRFRLQLVGSNR